MVSFRLAATAVALTAATGAATGGAGSIASDLFKGQSPNLSKAALSAVTGGVGAAVGARIGGATAARLGALARSSDNVVSGIAATTRSAANFGKVVQVGATAGQGTASFAADLTFSVMGKAAENALFSGSVCTGR